MVGNKNEKDRIKIGIAGAGGIGSNVAVNIVRALIFEKKQVTLKIIDFDNIESSNLNRQFYFKDQIGIAKVEALKENLKKISPDIDIEIQVTKLDEGNIEKIFSDCDIVVEAFDKKIYKRIFLEKLSDKKLLVCASGIGNYDLEDITTRKISKNIYIVGDFKSDIENFKTYPTKVQIIATMMANIVLDKGGLLSE